MSKALLVGRFQQTRSEHSVDLDRCVNHLAPDRLEARR